MSGKLSANAPNPADWQISLCLLENLLVKSFRVLKTAELPNGWGCSEGIWVAGFKWHGKTSLWDRFALLNHNNSWFPSDAILSKDLEDEWNTKTTNGRGLKQPLTYRSTWTIEKIMLKRLPARGVWGAMPSMCVDPGDFCTYRWLPRTHIVQGKKEDSENRQEQKRTRNSWSSGKFNQCLHVWGSTFRTLLWYTIEQSCLY